MLSKLFEIHEQIVKRFNKKTKRFLYEKINWDVGAICIYGARGTGKTTLIIQHYHERYGNVQNALYISADHIHVIAHGLYEIADTYFKYGGKAIFIDEIHKYPNWQLELKNIIDVYGDKKIIFTGSSSLLLTKGKGDLSRRVVYYRLTGLSFREFLQFETDENLSAYDLDDIIRHHIDISTNFKKNYSILKFFNNYLEYGYYPFYLEGKDEYLSRLQNVIEKILFEDLPLVFNISQGKISVIKKLIWLISSSQPFTPNIDRISKNLGISREFVYHYLESLEKTGLILSVRRWGSGLRAVRKPAKIYMENTGLIEAVSEETGVARLIGTLRETFFANQLNIVSRLAIPPKGDFIVNDRYIFEIGGKNKDFTQIKDDPNAYLALDEIEIGFGRKIPLYLFGFLY